MSHIHWLGAGLASVPGLRRLIKNGHKLTLWERDLDKASKAVAGLTGTFAIREASDDAMAAAVSKGDIVVSMLPAPCHPQIAQLCLSKEAHFVSSSYISPEMSALDGEAKEKGLSFVNEVGLDPGIDHLLAHLLMDDYQNSDVFDKQNEHEFRSYCGGFPAVANAFKYKFSWSPLGVLKALASPAKALKQGKEINVAKPWDGLEDYQVQFHDRTEVFQSYPNRDSLPFMADYGFGYDWNVTEFVRGTLRLEGWAKAWQPIFKTIDEALASGDDTALAQLSDQLWAEHAYEAGEADRVVLSVELQVKKDGKTIWHKAKTMDSIGNARSSAMGRLVSLPVSLAVETIMHGKLGSGVQAAPSDPDIVLNWLEMISQTGDLVQHIDFLDLSSDHTQSLAAE